MPGRWSAGVENGNGYPILLMDKYSKGTLYVWTIPDNFRNLYALPAGVTSAIKDVVMRDFFVRIDGPSQVSLFAYDNGTFVVESFLPGQTEVNVTVNGEFTKLRNLVTGEVIASSKPDVPAWPFLRRRAPEAQRAHFHVPMLPHSFAAFAPEK